MPGIQVVNIVLGLASIVMFIIMFVVVIRIWNFHQEILRSGGYPTVSYHRAKRDAALILAGRAPWDYQTDEALEILSRYPDDLETAELTQRLIAQKNHLNRNTGEIPDQNRSL